MQDRQPGAPGQYKATVTAAELQKLQAGEQFTITMVRDDQPIVEGTPYSKAAVLPDALAAIICPDALNPTPADAIAALLPRNGKAAMTNHLPMGGNKVTGLGTPTADGDAVSLGYANGAYAPAMESKDHPGCYYRTVDGVTEWINPPMEAGVEYRTTERYQAKPVYARSVNFGMLPHTTTKTVSFSYEPITLVSLAGAAANGAEANIFPIVFSAGLVAFAYVGLSDAVNNVTVRTLQDLSSYTAVFTVKYTKD